MSAAEPGEAAVTCSRCNDVGPEFHFDEYAQCVDRDGCDARHARLGEGRVRPSAMQQQGLFGCGNVLGEGLRESYFGV